MKVKTVKLKSLQNIKACLTHNMRKPYQVYGPKGPVQLDKDWIMTTLGSNADVLTVRVENWVLYFYRDGNEYYDCEAYEANELNVARAKLCMSPLD